MDSSTLRSAGLGSGLDLLRTIKASGIAVGIPLMVVEELAAQKALDYSAAHEVAARAMDSLGKATPWKITTSVYDETNRVREYWQVYYQGLGTLLQASQKVFEDALAREANAIAPCKFAGPEKRPFKVGGRDAAIWLTAVDYARTHPDETVYFVSGNTKDFGDGTSYEPPMDADLSGIRDRFRHLTRLDDVVAEFAQPTSIDRTEIEAACKLPDVQDIVVRYAVDNWEMTYDWLSPGFEASAANDAGRYSTRAGWLDPAGVEALPLSFNNIAAYRIGEQVWATVDVGWELGGWALHGDDDEFAWICTCYETRLLVSFKPASVTVLGDTEPHTLDYEPVNRPERFVDADKMRAALLRLQSLVPVENEVAFQREGAEKHRLSTVELRRMLNERLDARAGHRSAPRRPGWNRWHDGPPL
nr:PIN domain-containing protein [Streptomyces sp. SID8356]